MEKHRYKTHTKLRKVAVLLFNGGLSPIITKLERRLRLGANHYDPTKRARYLAYNNLSATQMTNTMIDDFWEILDHQANTSSGFSATLMKNKKTGEFTLSFRSTESKQSIDGGDVELIYFKEAA